MTKAQAEHLIARCAALPHWTVKREPITFTSSELVQLSASEPEHLGGFVCITMSIGKRAVRVSTFRTNHYLGRKSDKTEAGAFAAGWAASNLDGVWARHAERESIANNLGAGI